VLRALFSHRERAKVFCIGRNKTATTSLKKALQDLGYKVGDQATAELLIHEYAQRNFRPIVEYCRTADAFQDIPFSLPYTYQAMDYAFPKSKFILSIRDSEDEWYHSLIRFHQKRLKLERGLTKEDFVNDPYRYKGFVWDANRIVYGTPEDDPFNEEILKAHYLKHNEEIVRYFKFRDDLLVINLKELGAYSKFCAFLDAEPVYDRFPVLNQSSPAVQAV
jgi:hypothetical protein